MSKAEVCRLCANMINSESHNLFRPEQKTLLWQIEKLTGLQLKNKNNLPRLVCSLCQIQAVMANDFRERCIQAQQHFITEEYRNQIKEVTVGEVVYEITMLKVEIIEDEQCNIKIEPSSAASDPAFPETHYDADANMPEVDVFGPEAFLHIENELKTPRSKRRSVAATAPINKNTHRCDECSFATSRLSDFDNHMRGHNEKEQLQCKFAVKSELQSHIQQKHGKSTDFIIKSFACRYCAHRSNSSGARYKHELSHSTKAKRRRYPCTECDRSFSNSTDLKRHGVIHTGERPYECYICNISFGFTKHLKQHQNTKIHKLTEAKYKAQEAAEQ